MFALFKDGVMISKPYATQDECAIAAMSRGLVKRMPVAVEVMLAPGVSICDLNPVGKP